MARQQARQISGAAADILNIWITAKTPEEREQLSIEPKIESGHDANIPQYKDAWIALKTLKQERQEAMLHGGDGVTVKDWWHQGASECNQMVDQDENEGMEYVEEAEDGSYGDESDAMSVGSEGGGGSDEEDENEPPEPVSPTEYAH